MEVASACDACNISRGICDLLTAKPVVNCASLICRESQLQDHASRNSIGSFQFSVPFSCIDASVKLVGVIKFTRNFIHLPLHVGPILSLCKTVFS